MFLNMSIVSLSFFILVAMALVIYYIVPKKWQWIVLLLTSLVFFYYVGTPWTIVYLLSASLVTWGSALRIKKIRESADKYNEIQIKRRTTAWLVVALVLDIGLLALLKYLNFILGNASLVYNLFSKNDVAWSVNWPAALGISFYTLQIVGYLLDSYWGVIEPQKNPLKFTLFTCFFPQLVSGPISRYSSLGEELYKSHSFKINNIMSGAIRIAVGLFKKVILADGLVTLSAMLVNMFPNFPGINALLILILYVIRIYADFAGCMDIVIGVAKCFDIEMVENFKNPFLSRSIQEFWQRWHITLGLWLRDYIMYPILRTRTWSKMAKSLKTKFGKRVAKLVPTHLAMLVLWFFMGLWHGGGWNFILEGVWFWAVIVLGEWCSPIIKKVTSKFDTENPFYVLFQRMRTTLIYAIGALMFKCGTISQIITESMAIFLKWDTYLLFAGLIAICAVGYFVIMLLNKYNFGKISVIAEKFIKYSLMILAIYLLGSRLGGVIRENYLVVSVAFSIFLLLTIIEEKNGGLAQRLEPRPIMYKFLVFVILIYAVIVFGFFGPGYNPADFIYGGF